ncbi:MAG TPA: hypothetical protein VLA99_02305 [Nitrospiraceae bacterium]|nr:hypothetical protein [Nitrospiraceae bacterium]
MSRRCDGIMARGIFRLALYSGVAALVAVGSGCGPTKVKTETSPYAERYHIKSVAVLPFQTLETPQVVDDRANQLSVPTSAKRSNMTVAIPPDTQPTEQATSVVPPAAAEIVTRLVWDRLSDRPGLTLRSLQEGERAWKESTAEAKSDEPQHFARKIATQLGVDAVVLGKVLVYRERVGSKLGADPAVVGFELRLVGSDGVTLWVGNYYEKQRPMNEDLWGFIERKGAFVTAQELAAYGVEKVLKEFPYGGQGSTNRG